MKLFRVDYEGGYLGGVAIVIAENEDDAVCKVLNHRDTANYKGVTAFELDLEEIADSEDGVIYNNCGEY